MVPRPNEPIIIPDVNPEWSGNHNHEWCTGIIYAHPETKPNPNAWKNANTVKFVVYDIMMELEMPTTTAIEMSLKRWLDSWLKLLLWVEFWCGIAAKRWDKGGNGKSVVKYVFALFDSHSEIRGQVRLGCTNRVLSANIRVQDDAAKYGWKSF